MKVSLAAEAELELISGAQYYTEQAYAALGEAFLSEFQRAAVLLIQHPRLGAKWRGPTLRLSLRRFPFSIVYVVRETEVRIIAVAHQSRKPGYWRGRG